MTKWTDHTLTWELPYGMDISDSERALITFAQGTTCVEKGTGDEGFSIDETGRVLSVELTQAETGVFAANALVEVQVNWIDSSGKRRATEIDRVAITRNLHNEVIE